MVATYLKENGDSEIWRKSNWVNLKERKVLWLLWGWRGQGLAAQTGSADEHLAHSQSFRACTHPTWRDHVLWLRQLEVGTKHFPTLETLPLPKLPTTQKAWLRWTQQQGAHPLYSGLTGQLKLSTNSKKVEAAPPNETNNKFSSTPGRYKLGENLLHFST